MKYCFVFIACLLLQQLNAQTYSPANSSRAVQEQYNKAMQYLNDGYVKEAIPVLHKVLEQDSAFLDAWLSLAGVYAELKNYALAIQYYEKVKNADSIYFLPYNLPYSINLAGKGRFQDAEKAIEQFLAISNLNERSQKSGLYRQQCYQFAIQYAREHPLHNVAAFAPKNLGDSVNSAQSEYYPTLTIDDSLLLFTRRGEGASENFYQSIIHHQHFSKAELVKGDINLQPYKGAITVSADGDWLIFAGNFKNGFGNFDLYISYRTPQGWSEPGNLGHNVNSEYWDSSPALSPDNHILYFSSNRPGGYGGRDLYQCIRQPNGQWGAATNMGPVINSAGDDAYPYIHADNQTFYYTSDGLPGYGGTDLFIMRKDSTGHWGKPENAGYPINTIENEGSISINSLGTTGYFASDRSDSRGGLDLYSFVIPPHIQPLKTLFVKGAVLDAVTQKGIPCAIELIDNHTGKPAMLIKVDELGKFFVPLPVGRNYTFMVNRKGYLPYSELFYMQQHFADSTYQKNILLQPIAKNAGFTFKNIQFNINSAELLPQDAIELNRVIEFLNDNPTVTIEVQGYTDNTGNETDNIILSTQRAKAVANYLAIHGIDYKRLSYKGLGSANPIADNTTEAGRIKNRRTVLVITGM
ncbi:OmpA family protein [Hydrotalea sp.]|uniref:OmpA family protein n=1 Tax=Hydrotalea sp. TaxID=2881279 RepID=UPI00260FBE33|nr:OmpA family protein [Hydrotalea sp.]